MLSKTSRSFTYLNAILYTILGTFLFLLPRNYTGLRVEGDRLHDHDHRWVVPGQRLAGMDDSSRRWSSSAVCSSKI